MIIINKIKQWYNSLRYFVILDPDDNSVTMSEKLFKHICNNNDAGDNATVFVFATSDNHFAFAINPSGIDSPTQLCDIQYNDKHKCIGFETLCPSVGRILYEYGLSAERKCKLSVSVKRTEKNSLMYYQIDMPYNK